jgi:hypothetical protein
MESDNILGGNAGGSFSDKWKDTLAKREQRKIFDAMSPVEQALTLACKELASRCEELERRILHIETLPIDVSDGITSSTKQLSDGIGLGLNLNVTVKCNGDGTATGTING